MFYLPGIAQGENTLSPDESRHAVSVLRLTAGDPIEITDGRGVLYRSVITQATSRGCEFRVVEKIENRQSQFPIHIAVAPTKNADRMEWFLEKAVEFGIQRVTFIACKNSERKTVNLERMEKIAISALKQSQQLWLPAIAGIIPFSNVLKETTGQRFIAHVDREQPNHLKDVAKPGASLVLIGPEGDFSPDEIQEAGRAGFSSVSLGANRLRTETAALAACHILTLINT